MKEENKYYNWYNGYSSIPFARPGWPGSKLIELGGRLYTSTLNGSISTYGFDEDFNASLIFTGFDTVIEIVPINGHKDKNFTLTIEVSRKQMINLSPGNRDTIQFGNDDFPPEQDFKNMSIFLAPYEMLNSKQLYLDRKVSLKDIENQQLTTMPGMQIKWYIDRNDATPWRNYKGGYKSKIFVRLVNIIHENQIGLPEFWQVIKEKRRGFQNGERKKFLFSSKHCPRYCDSDQNNQYFMTVDANCWCF